MPLVFLRERSIPENRQDKGGRQDASRLLVGLGVRVLRSVLEPLGMCVSGRDGRPWDMNKLSII